MQKGLPPLIWLRAFEAAARHQSFAAAAEEIGVTASAVSQQIRLLEERLGRALFVRQAKGVRLSEAGQAYRPVVAKAFEGLAQGTDSLFGRRGGSVVRLRATASFQHHWLCPRLPLFLKDNPEIALQISTSHWAPDSFEPNLDLEIRYGTGDWPDLETHRLTQDRLIPVAAPGWLEEHRAAVQEDRLAEALLIEVIGFAEGWPEWFALRGHQKGQTSSALKLLEVDSVATALNLVRAGAGPGLLRDWMLADDLKQGRLLPLYNGSNDGGLAARESFYLLMQTNPRRNKQAQAVADWLIAQAPA